MLAHFLVLWKIFGRLTLSLSFVGPPDLNPTNTQPLSMKLLYIEYIGIRLSQTVQARVKVMTLPHHQGQILQKPQLSRQELIAAQRAASRANQCALLTSNNNNERGVEWISTFRKVLSFVVHTINPARRSDILMSTLMARLTILAISSKIHPKTNERLLVWTL